jgi:transposase
MIHLPASVRVYLCLSPCDMRRSFDGLHALVRDHLQLDAFAGHLYLFANRRKRPRQDLVLGCVTNVSEILQSCAEDGSRPPGVGFQESASNPPEPLRPKGVVVNVRGKGVRRGRQVSVEKMSESEPSDDASSRIQGTVKTGAAQ